MQFIEKWFAVVCPNLTYRHSPDSAESKMRGEPQSDGTRWCERVAADTQQRNRFDKSGQ